MKPCRRCVVEVNLRCDEMVLTPTDAAGDPAKNGFF